MSTKSFFNTIAETALVSLLLLIIFGATISVLSLSPVSKQKVETQSQDPAKKVAGENTDLSKSKDVVFTPSFSTKSVYFGNQNIDGRKYSVDINFAEVVIGKNYSEIAGIMNLNNDGTYQINITASVEDLRIVDIYANVGSTEMKVNDELFDGKLFPYKFKMSAGEERKVGITLLSKEEINFPINVGFSVERVN